MKILVAVKDLTEFIRIQSALKHRFDFELIHSSDLLTFKQSLQTETIGLIISDHGQNTNQQLEFEQKNFPFIPFIIVSDLLTETQVVDILQNGATDFLRTENMGRLSLAIDRALIEKQNKETIRTIANGSVEVSLDKQRSERALVQISDFLNLSSGEDYFAALTKFLYSVIPTKVVFVGMFLPDENSVITKSFRINGVEQKAYKYLLVDTPCDHVLGKDLCFFAQSVQSLFPLDKDLADLDAESYIGIPVFNTEKNPTGLIVLIDDHPLVDIDEKKFILSIVANRTGNELDRVSTVDKLFESEEKYQRVVESQSEMIVRWELSGKVNFANLSFLSYHETSIDELKKQSYFDFVNDPERFNKKIANLSAKNPETTDVHKRINKKRGEVWNEWSDRLIFDQQGNIVEIQSIGRDITLQKKAEFEIQESEARLRQAQKIAKIGHWELDLKTGIRVWSRELFNCYNCDPDKPLPSLEDFIKIHVHPDDGAIIWDRVKQSHSGEKIDDSEYRILNHDGTYKTILAKVEVVFDQKGKPIKVQGTSQDITDQKLLDEGIKRSEEFSRSILSSLHANIAVINESGVIIATNAKWKLFANQNNGLRLKCDIGANYLDVIRRAVKSGDKLAENSLDGINSVFDKSAETFQMEYPCHSETEKRWFSMLVSPLTDTKSEPSTYPSGLVISHTDITEKKNNDYELETSYREILGVEKIYKALINGATTSSISGLILDGLYDSLGIDQSRIYLYDQEANELRMLAQKFSSELITQIEKKGSEKVANSIPKILPGSLFEKVILEKTELVTHEKTVIKKLMGEHVLGRLQKALVGWVYKLIGIKTFGVYPLMNQDKVLGILTMSTPGVLNDQEKKVILRYTQHASTVLSKKQDQDYILESESKFKKIFESIQDVYAQLTLDGTVILVSPSVEKLLGYKPEEIIGKNINDFYADKNLRGSKIGGITDTATHEFEAVVISKTQAEVFVSVKFNLLKNDWGRFYGAQSLISDITERKKQEFKLEDQRMKLIESVKLNTQIIETADQFFYVLEAENAYVFDNPIKYISPQVNEIFGISESDIRSKNDRWFGSIHPEDIERVKDAMDEVFRKKRPAEFTYRVMNHVTGHYIWVDDYACPLIDKDGNVTEIYGSVKDVSERKNALTKIENEKKQSSAYQFQLLSSQLNPHFIYNTLNSFQYYILSGKVEESLNHISEFSVLMRKVLQNSMSQQITLEDEIKFLHQYIQISKRRMKKELHFEINVHPDIDIMEQMIAPMLLQPYIENSIIHGFMDSPRDPVLIISITQIHNRIFCSIEDNGVGRVQSQELQQVREDRGKYSYAMGINQKRISLLNLITSNNFKAEVIDIYDESGATGTRVVINYLNGTQGDEDREQEE